MRVPYLGGSGGVIAMLKPLGILVLILILLSLGYSSLVEFLRKGISLQ
jgi:hypothetical protein